MKWSVVLRSTLSYVWGSFSANILNVLECDSSAQDEGSVTFLSATSPVNVGAYRYLYKVLSKATLSRAKLSRRQYDVRIKACRNV